MAQPGAAGPRRGAGRRRLPTRPTNLCGDLRRRDSRSCGRNVPRAPGSRKLGGCPSLLPPHPTVPSPHSPPPPAHSLFLGVSPFSKERNFLPEHPVPSEAGSCHPGELSLQSYPPFLLVSPRPTEVSIHYSPKHPRGSQRSPPAPARGCPGLEAVGGQPHP